MANEIIRKELRNKKVYQWELAYALGVSEQTMVRKMRFEMPEDEQITLLVLIEEIFKRKGDYL